MGYQRQQLTAQVSDRRRLNKTNRDDRNEQKHVCFVQLQFNNWFMLWRAYVAGVIDTLGKFGELERSVRVA